MTSISDSFLELFVRATALLALAHAALWLLRRRSAATRELVGRWFALALCMLPLLTLSGLSLAVLPALVPTEPAAAIAPESTPVAVLAIAPGAASHTPLIAPAPGASPWTVIAACLLLAWVLGSCLLVAFAVCGHLLASRRLFADAKALPDDARARLGLADARLAAISPAATQPMVAGLLRPRIALPAAFLDWPPARQRAVLAHERAHVRRRDGLATLLWQIARALWWPHPLVWRLGPRLALAREQACDDHALADAGGALAYAEALLDVARAVRCSDPSRFPLPAMTTTSQLDARVRALLRSDVRRTQPRALGRLATAVLVLGIGLVCAAGDAAAQEEPPPPPPPAVEAVEQPEPPPAPTGNGDDIVFVVTARDTLRHANVDIGLTDVQPIVRRLLAAGPRRVVVQCSRKATAGLLVRLIDEAKAAGAEQVAIATDARPRPIHRAAPKLPANLRAHTPATVTVRFVVDEQGRVVAPEVDETSDPRFDQPALEAIAKWRFEPAMRDGEPVRARLRVPIVFPAVGGRESRNPPDAAELLQVIVEPRPIRRVTPKLTDELRQHRPAIVWLSFVVDERGRVASPQVTRSTDPRFDQPALEAVVQWAFEPGMRGGDAVATEVEVALPFVDDKWLERGGELPPVLDDQGAPIDLDALLQELRKQQQRQQQLEQQRATGDVGWVKGIVHDADFDQPLPGAVVEILETGERTTTDDAGLFLCSKVPTGSYTLVFTKPGFQRQVKTNVGVPRKGMTVVRVALSGGYEDMERFVVEPPGKKPSSSKPSGKR